jgi:hypothetical protein
MNIAQRSAYRLAESCDGSPVATTVVVMLFFVMAQVVEASCEMVFFGERFAHILDPLMALAFMAYAAYAVYWCAIFNATKRASNTELCGERSESPR